MKSLFNYAEALQARYLAEGEVLSHNQLLDQAAVEVLDGHLSLADASKETQTRLSPHGLEIEPELVQEAVAYVVATPERNNLRGLNHLAEIAAV